MSTRAGVDVSIGESLRPGRSDLRPAVARLPCPCRDREVPCRPPQVRCRASDRRSRPGPRTPRLWQSLSYALRPYATVESARPWGDRYTVEAIGTRGKLVVFSDPEAVRDIFGSDGDTLRAGEATGAILGPLIGWHSLLVLDGEQHLHERRLISPPFHGERMHVYGRLMRDIAVRAITDVVGFRPS